MKLLIFQPIMERVEEFEYANRDMIGHGAFAIVFKGRYVEVSTCFNP